MSSKLRLQLRDYLLAFLVTNFVYLEVIRLVIHTNQIIIILKVKQITAYFLPRSCWDFMTNHWLFLLIWLIAHANSTITRVKELKNMCRGYHCFDTFEALSMDTFLPQRFNILLKQVPDMFRKL